MCAGRLPSPHYEPLEGCESGRIGTLGKRVWGNSPWVRIPPPPLMDNETAMDIALEEARAALMHGDVPIGALVLYEDRVIAQRHNERELTQDPTAHAEILALP